MFYKLLLLKFYRI